MMERTGERFDWSVPLALGSIWGLSEAAMGMYLRGGCARLLSGSIMTGVAIFFLAMSFASNRRTIGLLLMLGIASAFKFLDAALLRLPVTHGAIGNPIFAFYTEVLTFIFLLKVLDVHLQGKVYGRAILGGFSALVAANLFPLVRFVTGIPACVYPGTNYPLSLYFMPVAVGLSALTCLLGMLLGEKLARLAVNDVIPARAHRLVPAMIRLAPVAAIVMIILLRLG